MVTTLSPLCKLSTNDFWLFCRLDCGRMKNSQNTRIVNGRKISGPSPPPAPFPCCALGSRHPETDTAVMIETREVSFDFILIYFKAWPRLVAVCFICFHIYMKGQFLVSFSLGIGDNRNGLYISANMTFCGEFCTNGPDGARFKGFLWLFRDSATT